MITGCDDQKGFIRETAMKCGEELFGNRIWDEHIYGGIKEGKGNSEGGNGKRCQVPATQGPHSGIVLGKARGTRRSQVTAGPGCQVGRVIFLCSSVDGKPSALKYENDIRSKAQGKMNPAEVKLPQALFGNETGSVRMYKITQQNKLCIILALNRMA